MNGQGAEVILTVEASGADSAAAELDAGEAMAQEMALRDPRRPGILITRCSASSFTIALTMEVPFGLTREKQEW